MFKNEFQQGAYKLCKTALVRHAKSDELEAARAIYSRAAEISNTNKGFLLISNRPQKEQFSLLSALSAKIDFSKYIKGASLKYELQAVLNKNKELFGTIEATDEVIFDAEAIIREIKKYAKDIHYVFIEAQNCEDKEELTALQALANDLNVRIELFYAGAIPKKLVKSC